MRCFRFLPVLGVILLGIVVVAVADDNATPGGAGPGDAEAASSGPALGGGFRSVQPLGTFQPTDISGGGFSEAGAPNLTEPQPPQSLEPDPQAAPVQNPPPRQPAAGAFQEVAPAQFQTPAAPKTAPEPKTSVTPGAAPPLQGAAPSAGAANANGAAAPAEPQSLAQSLYQQAITAPASGALTGSALSLHQALSRRTDSSRYAEFVKAYWKLSQSLGTYYEAIQGVSELSRLPAPRVAHHQALLQAAIATAQAEAQQAKVAAVAAQWALAEQMTGEAAATIPQDAPLIAEYKSKFDAVFSGRLPPAGARRLHETFDARLALIEARAASTVAVENAFAALADGYAGGQIDLANVLNEHIRLQTARREFLRGVYDYNADIADYAYLAAGPHRSADIIVSMLVERKKPVVAPQAAPANFISP
jgi:hypothetical protein